MATKDGKKIKRAVKLRPDEARLKNVIKRVLSNERVYVVWGKPTMTLDDEGNVISGVKIKGYRGHDDYYSGMDSYRNIWERVTIAPERMLAWDFATNSGKMLTATEIKDWQEKNRDGVVEHNNMLSTASYILNNLSGSYYRTPEAAIFPEELISSIEETAKKMDVYNGKQKATSSYYRTPKGILKKTKEDYPTERNLKTFAFIDFHPEDNNSIIIYKINLRVRYNEETGQVETPYDVISYYEIIPGLNKSKVYNVRKTGDFESIREDILNLQNERFIFDGMCNIDGEPITTLDSSGLLKFFDTFPNFTKRTGMDVSVLLNNSWHFGSYFAKYCYLIAEFPVVEQLVKMSYWRLIGDIMNRLSSPKRERQEICDKIMDIIVPEATSGKKGLKLPSWVAAYVNEHMLSYSEIIAWSEFSEAANFTKESFEEFVHSSEFKLHAYRDMLGLLRDMTTIAVYGYAPLKTLKYVNRQAIVCGYDVRRTLNDLFDYARMCDIMGIQPDLYPKNIVKVHDEMAKAFRAYQDRELDTNIAKRCKALQAPLNQLKKLKIYEDSEFDIIVPEHSLAIIDEGQQQRNCVGSYTRNVANGSSTVFFVRRKDEIHKSYVTAEYKNGALTQCFYAGNRYVDRQSDEYKLAAAYCNEIKKHEAALAKQRLKRAQEKESA